MKSLIFLLGFSLLINFTLSQSLHDLHLSEKNSLNSKLYNEPIRIDTSGDCNIMLNTGMLLKEVNIIVVSDSTFTITKSEVDRVFPTSQLHKITFIKYGFWPGFTVGAIGSVAIWTLLGLANSSNNKDNIKTGLMVGFLLAAPTGLITGLISGFAGSDEDYKFGNAAPDVKAKRLKFLLQKNK